MLSITSLWGQEDALTQSPVTRNSQRDVSFRVLLGVGQQRRPGDVPLVRGEEEDVGAGRVHLVRLPGVDGLLLHRLDLQSVQLLIEHLRAATQRHACEETPCVREAH